MTQTLPRPRRSHHGNYPTLARPMDSSVVLEDLQEEDESAALQELIQELENSQTGRLLQVKQFDMVWDNSRRLYETQDAAFKPPPGPKDPDQEFAFIFQRKLGGDKHERANEVLPHNDGPIHMIEIRSPFLRYAARRVMGKTPGISWTATPLALDALNFVSYLEDFQAFIDDLHTTRNVQDPNPDPTWSDTTLLDPQKIAAIIAHVNFLLEFLRTEFTEYIETFKSLIRHGEITLNMLFHILRPGTLLFTNCPNTEAPRIVKLSGVQWAPQGKSWKLQTLCVIEDSQMKEISHSTKSFGWSLLPLTIQNFPGAKKINSLSVFPLAWHPRSGELIDRLVQRGEKWMSFAGVHHLQYCGTAFTSTVTSDVNGRRISIERTKISITGRVMVDKAIFSDHSMDHQLTPPPIMMSIQSDNSKSSNLASTLPQRDMDWDTVSLLEDNERLNKDHLLLTPPFVYGYSLEKKMWVELLVDNLEQISWNDEAFKNLVLPPKQKELLRKLMQAHRSSSVAGISTVFDDFVQGKGQGLVIHLYGNPGVGKSMTAEATSEHLRKPLYMVGAADLGTDHQSVDRTLMKVMNLVMKWGAVLLIDEADVFLEKRSLKDLERNAMVAVFLRRLEYFRGILFLTTNMVEAFDHAFHSRLHLSLLYPDLTPESMRKIWVAFMTKAVEGQQQDASLPDVVRKHLINNETRLTDKQLDSLCQLKINGRQIKNIVATATILANSQGELLSYDHLRDILDTA